MEVKFASEVSYAQGMRVTLKQTRENEAELYGPFSSIDWKPLRLLCLGIASVVSEVTANTDLPEMVQGLRVIDGVCIPTVRVQAMVPADTRTQCASAVRDLLVGVLEEKTLPLLSLPSASIAPKAVPAVARQREFFLAEFGGETIRMPLHVAMPDFMTVVLRGRWDRLPADEESVRAVSVSGAPDGFGYGPRTLFIEVDGGKGRRQVVFDEARWFDPVKEICHRIQANRRERYRFECEERTFGSRQTLILRDIVPLETVEDIPFPALGGLFSPPCQAPQPEAEMA